MKLKHETTEYFDSNVRIFEKDYNEKGLLILEKSNENGCRVDKTYEYDSQDRLINVVEIISGYSIEEKYLHKYDYVGDSYRILKYKVGEHDYRDDWQNSPDGELKWNEKNDLISIREYKYKDGCLVQENFYDLNDHSKDIFITYDKGNKVMEISGDKKQEFVYESNKLLVEKTTYINNLESTKTVYSYHEDLLVELTEYKNDNPSGKILNYYENKLLQKTETIGFKDNKQFVAFATIYTYVKDELSKIEKYGRYDTVLHLYMVQEFSNHGFTKIIKSKEIDYANYFLGFYDVASLNNYYSKEYGCDLSTQPNPPNMELDLYKFDYETYFVGKIVSKEHSRIRVNEREYWTLIHFEYDKDDRLLMEIGYSGGEADSHSSLWYIRKLFYYD